MKIVKSDKSLFVVKYVDDDCQWRLRAAKIPMSEFFSIRTYINTHTCGIEKRKKKHRQATAVVVADLVKTRYGGDIHYTPTPKAIIGMMNKFGAEVSYWKAWKERKIACLFEERFTAAEFWVFPNIYTWSRRLILVQLHIYR